MFHFNYNKMMRKYIVHILTLMLCLISIINGFAQSSLRANLSKPDLSAFPKITLALDVYDPQGSFVKDLNLRQIRIFENDEERILNEALLVTPGLDSILVLNLAPTLANKSASATRYEEIQSALSSWLNSIPPGMSDYYSLISNEGKLVDQIKDRGSLLLSLQGYQPNLWSYKPTLDSLKYALELAAQPIPVPMGKRAILYFTPLIVESELVQMNGLIEKAKAIGVPIYVWLVAPDTSANSTSATALNQLASQTGGRYFLWAENTSSPNLEIYLDSLRYTYRLRYTSAINQSGEQSVYAQVQRGDQQIDSAPQNFNIRLSAPVPSLLGLPGQITRSWIPDKEGRLSLQPNFLTLQMQVDFPDGYPRQLKAARLIVDGQTLLENTQAPFEFFAWVIEGFRNSGEHSLMVEVEDILGFRNRGLERKVQINVQPRDLSPWGKLWDFFLQGGWLLLMTLALGGIGYFLWLQRERIQAYLAARNQRVEEADYDPLTQPVSIPQENGELSQVIQPSDQIETQLQKSIPRLTWASKSPAPKAYAVIPLPVGEISLGSDPSQAIVVLRLRSVEKIHAVITLDNQDRAHIANRSQKAGTWLNYAPVSERGADLHEGDLVRIGKALFRFEIQAPSAIRKELEKF